MTFWNDAEMMPKRSHSFLMTIVGADEKIDNFMVKKTNKPGFTISKTTHKFLNHSFHFPGKIEWKPVKVTLVDSQKNDSATRMMKILDRAGYKAPVGPTFQVNDGSAQTISKKKFVKDALVRVMIEQVDDDGNMIDQWTLMNPWISDVDMGNLDYDSDDMLTLEIEFTYDWAKLTNPDGDFLPDGAPKT